MKGESLRYVKVGMGKLRKVGGEISFKVTVTRRGGHFGIDIRRRISESELGQIRIVP